MAIRQKSASNCNPVLLHLPPLGQSWRWRLAEVTTASANVSVITFPPPKFVIRPSTFSPNTNERSHGMCRDIFMVSKLYFCVVKKKKKPTHASMYVT